MSTSVSAAMTALTPARRAVLHAALKGPLFQGMRRWRRPGFRVSDQTVAALVAAGLLARSVTSFGVPMVRLTDAGRAALGEKANASHFRRRIDIEAEAAAAREA